MKILIACDSFKDCLSSQQVAKHISSGLLQVSGDFDIKTVAIADGGEGTVEAIVEASGGSYISAQVHDPLKRIIVAKYGLSGNSKTAVIEMSAASGIELLKKKERNPWITTSYGTGELIKDALDRGLRRLIIGIGGSATNDGGIGMASALGIGFLDCNDEPIEPTGGSLQDLVKIDLSGIDSRIAGTEIIIASDVENPLTGALGASFVYGAQKGANSEMIRKLDNNLQHLSKIIYIQLGIDVQNIPGSGAAGGMGAGLMAFLKAKMQNGFGIVKSETRLEQFCSWADVVITGEGKIDNQTRFGKAPQGVANTAKQFNKKVFAVAGTLGNGYQELYTHGFDLILSIIDKPVSLETALKEAPQLLQNAGYTIGKILNIK